LRVSFVNLQKLTLCAVLGTGEHPDVGSRTEHAILAGTQQYDLHVGMLESQSHQGIGEFDVDGEIAGVQLLLIAFIEPGVLVDVQGQRCDLAVDGELPTAIARWIGLEIDEVLAVGDGCSMSATAYANKHGRYR
jgi:hypothetical protein